VAFWLTWDAGALSNGFSLLFYLRLAWDFYYLQHSQAFMLNGSDNSTKVFHAVLKSDELIEGIAGPGLVIAICWMPFAALLSLIAFVITWMDQTKTQGEENYLSSYENYYCSHFNTDQLSKLF
jgi:hypothetical protein